MTTTEQNNKLFDQNGCISPEALALYIDKKLSEGEIKTIMAHASECQLCKDALEGAVHFSDSKQFNYHISKLHQSKFRRSFNKNGKKHNLYYGISAAAASIILFFGLYFLVRLEKIVEQDISEIVLLEEKFVKHDSIQPPAVPDIITEAIKDIPTEAIKEKSDQITELKPVRPLEPEEEIVIAEVEEEITVEELEFNGIEYDIELETIAMEAAINSDEDIATSEPDNNAIAMNMSMPAENLSAAKTSIKEEELDDKSSRSRYKKAKRSEKGSEAYYMAEVTPMFQGGNIDLFNTYLADNLKVIIPDSVLIESIIISFVIDTTGNISKVKLVSGTSSEELNKHILDFVKESPVWIPGYTAGRPIETLQETEIVLDSTHKKDNQ